MKIVYIGKRVEYVDGLYSTGIIFPRGVPVEVEDTLGRKLLKLERCFATEEKAPLVMKQMQEENDRIAAAATMPSETEEEDDLMDYDKSIVQLEDKDFEDFKDFENDLEELDDKFLKEIIEAGDLNGIE